MRHFIGGLLFYCGTGEHYCHCLSNPPFDCRNRVKPIISRRRHAENRVIMSVNIAFGL